MKIINERIEVETGGNPDLIDITGDIASKIASSKLDKGSVTVFVAGSTAAITTFEFEPGLIRDMRELYEKIATSKADYKHDETWGDANGYSHLRAALQGPSVTVPFESGKMLLGTWQQIVLAEFDNRPRQRHIIVQIIGE